MESICVGEGWASHRKASHAWLERKKVLSQDQTPNLSLCPFHQFARIEIPEYLSQPRHPCRPLCCFNWLWRPSYQLLFAIPSPLARRFKKLIPGMFEQNLCSLGLWPGRKGIRPAQVQPMVWSSRVIEEEGHSSTCNVELKSETWIREVGCQFSFMYPLIPERWGTSLVSRYPYSL